jgi:hypothetical protein
MAAQVTFKPQLHVMPPQRVDNASEGNTRGAVLGVSLSGFR